MNTTKFMIWGLLLVLTLISGVILSNLGKPFNGLIFTVHKLIAVGTVIGLSVNVYHLSKAAELHTFALAMIATSGLLFLALIVSGGLLSVVDGGLLSLDKPLLQAVLRVHQVAPLLVVVSSTISIYLLISSEALSRIGITG
jgi:hypothetical protein